MNIYNTRLGEPALILGCLTKVLNVLGIRNFIGRREKTIWQKILVFFFKKRTILGGCSLGQICPPRFT
jgi:hypothetical protein